MPVYVFLCTECGLEFEKHMEYNDLEPECDRCAGRVRRKYTPPAIMLNGPGFYSTDNRKS